jgi:hypothetical protein
MARLDVAEGCDHVTAVLFQAYLDSVIPFALIAWAQQTSMRGARPS